MKKTLCFILSVLLFSLCPLAFAEGTSADNWHPILEDGLPEYNMPPIPDGYEDEFFIPGQKNYGVMQSDKIITTVTESGDYFTGMTWTVSASGDRGSKVKCSAWGRKRSCSSMRRPPNSKHTKHEIIPLGMISLYGQKPPVS